MDAVTITREQFENLGQEMFGGSRWGSKMADATGLSTALVSNIRRGITPITTKTEAKVLAAYDRVKRPEGVHHDFDDDALSGDASIGLRLIAVDLRTNKFVGIHNVDPAKFFPEFAPSAEPVQTTVNAVPCEPLQLEGRARARRVNEAQQEVFDDEDMTDGQILQRIDKRVNVMDGIAAGVINGEVPSMIVYGAPGIGKSYTIMKAIEDRQQTDPEFHADVIKGSVRAPGLYKALFKARHGGVVVLDDSDSIFGDEEALNLLKAALDSGETRRISWRKQSAWIADLVAETNKNLAHGEEPITEDDVRDFEFQGGVIFITNINLKTRAKSGEKMADHFQALISRSFYVDLTMDSPRAKALRVRQVFLDKGMATSMGLDQDEAEEIVAFIEDNRHRFDEISLRMATLITKAYFSSPEDWKDIIEVTKMS